MRTLFLLFVLAVYSTPGWSASSVPDTKINHAWVQGVYWNPGELPGWGIFVDAQEENFFGAVYGYMGSESTFITLQGKITSADPLTYRGDVFFVTNGGTRISDVGNFTWTVGYYEAMPSGILTISSNILNRSNLTLVRFRYTEIDNIDIITGANWNIVEHVLITFGSNLGITDERFVEDGKTFVAVIDNDDTDAIGIAAYYPPGEGELFGMLVPFDEDSFDFYVFFATDSNMYGRYWLLDEGETPTGSGYYFHGSIAGIQEANDDAGGGVTSTNEKVFGGMAAEKRSPLDVWTLEEAKALKRSIYRGSEQVSEPIISQEKAQAMFDDLYARLNARRSVSGVGESGNE